MSTSEEHRRPRLLEGLGRNVVVLGVVSLFTDISSEMLYPVVPLFLTVVLHAPMSVVGVIEGIAESTASLLKVASGWWSDRMKSRRPLVVAGYGLSSLSKPLVAIATTWHIVLLARIIDRIGKGVRTSPRDALIAASCDPAHRGKAFGLHRAMDTAGALLGPAAALLILSRFPEGSPSAYKTIFLLAFIPAALGVMALAFLQRESAPAPAAAAAAAPVQQKVVSPELKRLLIVVGIFALGNSSDVFLLLKVKASGFSATAVLFPYMFYNFVYALAATPVGRLSDRLGRRVVMAGGFFLFAGVYVGFSFSLTPLMVWLLFGLYALYAAATESIAKAYVTDLSLPQTRGTAMGVYNTVIGLFAFVASATAGLLWKQIGPYAPFVFGASCSALAGVLALTFLRHPRPPEPAPPE